MSAQCGEYAGYQTHKRRGEQPCVPCMTANRDYMREYRKRNGTASDLAYVDAYHRAERRLREMHPAIFAALLAEERQRDES